MIPADFGPIYAETLPGRFPVEPWNTASNLIFLMVFLVFARKTRLSPRVFPVTAACLVLLISGFIGGTVYHATRSRAVWLFLDFVPIFLISLVGAGFFWFVVLRSIGFAALALVSAPVIAGFLRSHAALPPSLHISAGYLALALTVLLPAVVHCRLHARHDWRLLVRAVSAFTFAIVCRSVDDRGILPMGTHFLWHLFGGVSTFWMFSYLFRAEAVFRSSARVFTR